MSATDPNYDPSKVDPQERLDRFTWKPGDFEFLSPEEASKLLGQNEEDQTGGQPSGTGPEAGGGQQPQPSGPPKPDQPAG
jgi:hypothetical protein